MDNFLKTEIILVKKAASKYWEIEKCDFSINERNIIIFSSSVNVEQEFFNVLVSFSVTNNTGFPIGAYISMDMPHRHISKNYYEMLNRINCTIPGAFFVDEGILKYNMIYSPLNGKVDYNIFFGKLEDVINRIVVNFLRSEELWKLRGKNS